MPVRSKNAALGAPMCPSGSFRSPSLEETTLLPCFSLPCLYHLIT